MDTLDTDSGVPGRDLDPCLTATCTCTPYLQQVEAAVRQTVQAVPAMHRAVAAQCGPQSGLSTSSLVSTGPDWSVSAWSLSSVRGERDRRRLLSVVQSTTRSQSRQIPSSPPTAVPVPPVIYHLPGPVFGYNPHLGDSPFSTK